MKREKIIIAFLALLPFLSTGQYKLNIISDSATYAHLPRDQQLVSLLTYVPDILTDLVYATKDNFVHQILYQHPKILVARPMAIALQKAAIPLRRKGFGMLIYDAYRPYSVTEKMWQIVPDSRYAADPKNGSDHNRGAAIDLSLYSLKTGKPILMPTSFDNFTEKAHSNYMLLSNEIIANRKILYQALTAVDLRQLSTEWWHFYLPDSKNYPILNIDFDSL